MAESHFGKPNPALQQFDCNYKDFDSLVGSMPSHLNPLNNWRKEADDLILADCVDSWFRGDDHVLFYGPPSGGGGERAPLTYAQLQKEIKSFAGYKMSTSINATSVVALLLPQTFMAETAVSLITLLAQPGVCVAPMDPNMPSGKIVAALDHLQCTALVTTKELYNSLPVEATNVLQDVRLVAPSLTKKQVGVVDWTIIKEDILQAANFEQPSVEELPGLLLRTSGTTSTPKIVPIARQALLYNATCLAASLQLDPSKDVGCNAMPLFHIGGIACGLLAVLVSGASIVMMPGPFDGEALMAAIATPTATDGTYAQPTWYSGVPSMHKTLLLTAKAHQNHPSGPNNTQLRFIRNGAAHLSHATAVELATVFKTQVYQTYSMSECMPICSCHDVAVGSTQQSNHLIPGCASTQSRNGNGTVQDETNTPATLAAGEEITRDGVPDDNVGIPIGCSLAVCDEHNCILPYGQTGEVVLKGPGVINGYVGIPRGQSHTPQGWFKTGDMGQLDTNGRLVLSGRIKEMIKRGGDQVWPLEVDSIVESVPGVLLAVTFGVANDLWGEEVQVAVVLDEVAKDAAKRDALEKAIAKQCKEHLGSASVPSRVHYVESPNDLLKGSTGKFLRTKLADHLGAKPVDTGALHALETLATMSAPADVSKQPKQAKRATPSDALNGVRFFCACLVVFRHIGFMPNNTLHKLRTFGLNMSIFFMLGAFQLTASVESEVKSTAAQFIGTKIGSMHSLYIVSQCIALGSYLLFQCGENGYTETFQGRSCTEDFSFLVPTFVLHTLTGFGAMNLVNNPAWFQTSFYIFLVVFPFLDYHLRKMKRGHLVFLFWLNMFIASVGIATFFAAGGSALSFSFPSWLPALVTAMIAGYWFSNNAKLEDPIPGSAMHASIFQRPRLWGNLTDVLSIILLLLMITVALSEGCAFILVENYMHMRPGQPLPGDHFELHGSRYCTACDLTYKELEAYVQAKPEHHTLERLYSDLDIVTSFNFFRFQYLGRMFSKIGLGLGFFRLGTPLVLLWLFGLAYGRGLTATVMKTRPLQKLAKYTYALYLLHTPISKFYWVATRGYRAEFWWANISFTPVPVEWYEVFIIIAICIALAIPLDRFVVQHLSQYTVAWGVAVCDFLAKKWCPSGPDQITAALEGQGQSLTFQQVTRMVQCLTGIAKVDRSTDLQDLGLDSLGATALLGTLRFAVPNARSLTLAELSTCQTVGSLVDMLDDDTKPLQLQKKEQ